MDSKKPTATVDKSKVHWDKDVARRFRNKGFSAQQAMEVVAEVAEQRVL